MKKHEEMSEEEYLRQYDPTQFKRPSITVDAIVLTYREEQIQILLIKRGKHPNRGMWATPGGFIEFGEEPSISARRELEEETGIKARKLFQLGAYGDPERDPRPHIISIIYYAPLPASKCEAQAGDDAEEAGWFNLYRLPRLACDHNKICGDLRKRLRVDFQDPAFARRMLEPDHTEKDILRLYEIVYGRKVSRRDIDSLQKALF